MNATIRPVTEKDNEAVQKLFVQLGYQPNLHQVTEMIRFMNPHPDYEVVVMEINGAAVGCMTLQVRFRIEEGAFLQIAALVTDQAHRGQGLGKQMLEYAENHARKKNISSVALYTNKKRIDAHRFYQTNGYELLKESLFFGKKLK
jgi:GNAT superfamily N-acetyltransferase